MMPFDAKNKLAAFALAMLLGFFCLAVFYAGLFYSSEKIAEGTKHESKTEVITPKPDPFADVELEARAAYALDVSTGEALYRKNEEAELPLASLTKVMTALVASDLPQDTIITIDRSDLENGSGGLLLGERWHLKDLLDYTLVVSSNSGAKAIARTGGSDFIQKMNDEAKALRLDQTFYLNPNGLDLNVPGGLSGAYGSARDMADLFGYIVSNKPELLSATVHDSLRFTSLGGLIHPAENTNTITKNIPGLLASKTGLTDLAGGNLVVAFSAAPGHTIAIAVLDSTREGRFADVEKLVKATRQEITQRKE